MTSIALVGKYVDLQDSYLSVKEALFHAGLMHGSNIEIDWVAAEDVERVGPERLLDSVSGIVVPGGFGERGVEGMNRDCPVRPGKQGTVFRTLPRNAGHGN